MSRLPRFEMPVLRYVHTTSISTVNYSNFRTVNVSELVKWHGDDVMAIKGSIRTDIGKDGASTPDISGDDASDEGHTGDKPPCTDRVLAEYFVVPCPEY